MEMTLGCKYLIAATAILLGGLPIGVFISLMYYHLLPRNGCRCTEGFGWLVFFVGATERGAALILTVFAPVYLGPFVGGWMTFKYAANWQANDAPIAREKGLLALVGTAWSFAIAIGAGLLISHEAIVYFTDWKTHGH